MDVKMNSATTAPRIQDACHARSALYSMSLVEMQAHRGRLIQTEKERHLS